MARTDASKRGSEAKPDAASEPRTAARSRRAAKPKPETEAAIIDGAAALLARHGFARTSLKLIAQGLGYTNAGLLHHYASKQALFDAVLHFYIEQLRLAITRIEQIPPGIARDLAFIEDAIEFAFTWPGLSAFGIRMMIDKIDDESRFTELGLAVLALTGIDPIAIDRERLMRVYGAMTAVNHSCRLVQTTQAPASFRPMILAAAMDMLGHHGSR